MHFYGRLFFFITLLFCVSNARAQDKPIGYWESHLPYNTALGVATDGTTVFTVTGQAFFTYNVLTDEIQTYSKTDGMSDIGMQCIGYDPLTATVILCYQNGNIDLFKDNTFYNIPELKLLDVPTNKNINQVYIENGKAFLSTSLGVTEIDLSEHSITRTLKLYTKNNNLLNIKSFAGCGSYYYAATAKNLYRVSKTNPELINFQVWQNIDSTDSVTNLVNVNERLYLSTRRKLYTIDNDTLHLLKTFNTNIVNISAGKINLFIGLSSGIANGTIQVMSTENKLVDSFDCVYTPAQTAQLHNDNICVACPVDGLKIRDYFRGTTNIIPPGPSSPYSFGLFAHNKDLYIAHGGFNDAYFAQFKTTGFSNLYKGKWTQYKPSLYKPMLNMRDFTSVVKDETSGILYAGSYLDGLMIMHPDGYTKLVNTDSVFDYSIAYGNGYHQILGMAIDKSHNLWVSTMFNPGHQLYMLTPDSTWYKFGIPQIVYGGPPIIDDSDQIWIPSASGGLVVFNHNNTYANTADDTSYVLAEGVGHGNLPSGNVLSLAKDLDNNIWVGTASGIAVVTNCNAPFNKHTPPCDAEIPVDESGEKILAAENITDIVVDGGNRKWVGTLRGVYVLSPDGKTIVNHYDRDNSPLPSNYIRKLTIDKATGDIYFGTELGLVSYHGAATEGGTTNANVLVFPNPVAPGYSGPIAINGLVTSAKVKITDISGQLVYQTTALGGQAIWNGRDYTGRKPQSGVYLIFVSDEAGKQTYSGKIIFMQ